MKTESVDPAASSSPVPRKEQTAASLAAAKPAGPSAAEARAGTPLPWGLRAVAWVVCFVLGLQGPGGMALATQYFWSGGSMNPLPGSSLLGSNNWRLNSPTGDLVSGDSLTQLQTDLGLGTDAYLVFQTLLGTGALTLDITLSSYPGITSEPPEFFPAGISLRPPVSPSSLTHVSTVTFRSGSMMLGVSNDSLPSLEAKSSTPDFKRTTNLVIGLDSSTRLLVQAFDSESVWTASLGSSITINSKIENGGSESFPASIRKTGDGRLYLNSAASTFGEVSLGFASNLILDGGETWISASSTSSGATSTNYGSVFGNVLTGGTITSGPMGVGEVAFRQGVLYVNAAGTVVLRNAFALDQPNATDN
ncbi:MAG: hypothetical protein RLZZ244_2300, partial [Verrucomicrobiota bacterium]